jgi:hypothetical protein
LIFKLMGFHKVEMSNIFRISSTLEERSTFLKHFLLWVLMLMEAHCIPLHIAYLYMYINTCIPIEEYGGIFLHTPLL